MVVYVGFPLMDGEVWPWRRVISVPSLRVGLFAHGKNWNGVIFTMVHGTLSKLEISNQMVLGGATEVKCPLVICYIGMDN